MDGGLGGSTRGDRRIGIESLAWILHVSLSSETRREICDGVLCSWLALCAAGSKGGGHRANAAQDT